MWFQWLDDVQCLSNSLQVIFMHTKNIKFLSFFVFKLRLVVEYHVQTYEVPDDSACPDYHVKCCKDYIEVAGNCLG